MRDKKVVFSQNVMAMTLMFLHDHMGMEFVIEDGKVAEIKQPVVEEEQ